MADWLPVLARLSASKTPSVLVTLAEARGSVPREAGTKMLVTADASFGTIGGGQLEYEALTVARAMLADGAAAQLHRFGLGPSLGQCCGGSAHVLFEGVAPQPAPWQAAQGLARSAAEAPGAPPASVAKALIANNPAASAVIRMKFIGFPYLPGLRLDRYAATLRMSSSDRLSPCARMVGCERSPFLYSVSAATM